MSTAICLLDNGNKNVSSVDSATTHVLLDMSNVWAMYIECVWTRIQPSDATPVFVLDTLEGTGSEFICKRRQMIRFQQQSFLIYLSILSYLILYKVSTRNSSIYCRYLGRNRGRVHLQSAASDKIATANLFFSIYLILSYLILLYLTLSKVSTRNCSICCTY